MAALAYLGDCGRTEDLVAIRAEFDSGDHQTTYAAVDAILHINLRDSQANAIRALIELQPESIKEPLLEALFEKGSSIETVSLTECLAHRSSDIRRVAISLLRERGAMDIDAAGRLILDPDAHVRLEALKSLVDAGRTFSDEEARGILVKPTASSGMLAGTDAPGERNWRRWRRERLTRMPLGDLEQAASNEFILDRTSHFVLTARRFSQHGPKLRQSIDNRFKAEFEVEIGGLEKKIGIGAETIDSLKSLEENIRKTLTREGLDIICQQGDKTDLGLVRHTLAGGFVELSTHDLAFLYKFGNWEDIQIILSAVNRSDRLSLLILSNYEGIDYSEVARTIYRIGRERLRDLFDLEIPIIILVRLINKLSSGDFRQFDDQLILRLLHSDSNALRQIVALRSISTLSKVRLRRLLSLYISDGIYFYDIVHLLDFGITISKERVVAATKRALIRELSFWI